MLSGVWVAARFVGSADIWGGYNWRMEVILVNAVHNVNSERCGIAARDSKRTQVLSEQFVPFQTQVQKMRTSLKTV
jgi:hypothetical protein